MFVAMFEWETKPQKNYIYHEIWDIRRHCLEIVSHEFISCPDINFGQGHSDTLAIVVYVLQIESQKIVNQWNFVEINSVPR